jgi:diguanylate cyclase (GGDEF)-like protein
MFSVAAPAQQYAFRAFRQAEGLNNLSVSSLQTDRAGYLWAGTENGLYRFLGFGFERYGPEQGIAELDIRDVVSDQDGTIWVATEGNLYRWDGQRFFPAGRDPIVVAGPRRVAVEDARHLLVVEKGHLYRLEHDTEGRMLSFLPVFPDSLLASMADLAYLRGLTVVREPGNVLRIWAGCGSGLCSWVDQTAANGARPQDGDVTEWGKENGLAVDRWENVLLARDGTLWAGGFAHVAVLPPGAARFADRTIPGSGPQSEYSHAPLIEDPEGRILAPAEEGIARWDGTAWKIIGHDNGMERANRIMDMVFDAAGDLWFASRGDGLYQWPGYEDWEGWGYQQGLPSAATWAISTANADHVFVGTEGGPAWINLRSGTANEIADLWRWPYGLVGGMVADRDGSLLAGTASGAILRIEPKTGRMKRVAKVPARVVVALRDSSGRIFFGTVDGLYLRESGVPGDRSSSQGWKVEAAPVALPRVKAVDALLGGSSRILGGCKSPGGDLWFLSNNRLVRFKDGAWTAPPIDRFPATMHGSLLALSCAPNGAIWVTGDQTGTWRLTPGDGRLRAWHLKVPPGLRTLSSLAVLADRHGWVWLGTDMGLLAWNGQNWRHLTQESGLIWNDVNEGVMQEAADGSLWIGTSGGVSHLLHPERVFDPIPLTVSLVEFQRGKTSYLGAQKITMSWAGPPLLFRISSATMRNLSELVLKIKMEGFQPEWMQTQTGNATFARLPPGKYTFMAMACNPGLNACSVPVKIDIHVLPPWWRTSWFYGLCSLTFLALLIAFIRLYARQLHARSRQLEMLVSERTRELEASREQLRIQATHDGLTGMLNRMAILRALAAETDRALRENRTVVVALVDLDHFKSINDTCGHLAGDEALRWFAAAVGAAIRPYDHAGRYGGEEFLLVLTEVPREVVEQRLVSLQESISNLTVCARGVQFQLNCSMGATVFDPSESPASVETLLAVADQALYAAKAAGRNRVVFRLSGGSDTQQEKHEQTINPVEKNRE